MTAGGRYRYLEVATDPDPVAIIQDTENDRAWLQSSLFLAVEQ